MAVDPLAEIVTLLQPAARFSKLVECVGSWRIRREATGEPFYCAIPEGSCRVTFGGHRSFVLQAGDFVLVPAMQDLINESIDAPTNLSAMLPTQVDEGHFRVGRRDGPADLRMRIGHCSFGAPDSALLVSLLPDVVLVRDRPRLATLMQLVDEETREQCAAREIVLERLLEVLLIEALRSGTGTTAAPGLSRGLADERPAAALHAMHARPAHSLDCQRSCKRSRTVSFCILCAFQPHRRPVPDGVSAGLAHGARKTIVAEQESRSRTGGRTRGLRVGKHLQCRVCATCGNAPGSICAHDNLRSDDGRNRQLAPRGVLFGQ